MLSKSKLKYVQSLKLKKKRDSLQRFVVEGEKMVKELLNSDFEVEEVFVLNDWTDNIPTHYAKAINIVTLPELKKLSFLSTPNKVMAIVTQPNYIINYKKINKTFSLYLDGIRDPGNMGTILRIADWFGISAVFCSIDCVDIYNPKVIQASMGAFLRVKTSIVLFENLKKEVGDIPIYGATMAGENVFKSSLSKEGILVIGNEGAGISAAILQELTHAISIPRHQQGGAESLNAAIATGILCALFRGFQ